MEEIKRYKRRYNRYEVEGQVAGHIGHIPKVSLINVSTDGALIEHSKIVRPGTLCFLTLLFPGKESTLKCRVVRSALHRSEVLTSGERDVIYRSGVEFLDASEAARQLINEYIDSLKRVSRATRRRKRTRSRVSEPTQSRSGAAPRNPSGSTRKRK
ncbi:MAG: PilZ domain-containing protein [Candidatus Methylomirabilales bacterium]